MAGILCFPDCIASHFQLETLSTEFFFFIIHCVPIIRLSNCQLLFYKYINNGLSDART